MDIDTLTGWCLFFTLRILLSASLVTSVEIRRLSVPRWVQNGTTPIVLDCDYVYNENDLRLVVKWFLNDQQEPVYQWIPELNLRHTAGLLRGRLDLEFSVKPRDPYSRYRALRIQNPTTELSGTYTCLVTSLAGQDSRRQRMLVYAPAEAFTFNMTRDRSKEANVTCEAKGVYPLPKMELYVSGISQPNSLISILGVKKRLSNTINGFDVLLSKSLGQRDLDAFDIPSFHCVLEIPGTDYARAKRITFYSDSGHVSSGISLRIGMYFCLLHLLLSLD